MSYKLIKKNERRRRLVKIPLPISDFNNWQSYLVDFKKKLSLSTHLSLVNEKIYFEINPEDQNITWVMLEVVGVPLVPQGPDKMDLVLFDLDPLLVEVGEICDFDPFSIDFPSLLIISEKIKAQHLDLFGAYFLLVLNQTKIELHFFRQKDYIQRRL